MWHLILWDWDTTPASEVSWCQRGLLLAHLAFLASFYHYSFSRPVDLGMNLAFWDLRDACFVLLKISGVTRELWLTGRELPFPSLFIFGTATVPEPVHFFTPESLPNWISPYPICSNQTLFYMPSSLLRLSFFAKFLNFSQVVFFFFL